MGRAQVPERREATVDFVYFTGTPKTDEARGGTAPATMRVEQNRTNSAAVGVIEEFAGGTGAQWRSTAWIAAFTASTRAKQSFLANEFTVRSGGHVDGPSAGMLTTATFLALLRGDVVKTDVTMTGTINPDGTSGPVGGIPQKLAGAAAAGKKAFGYPMGMRQAEDLRTGAIVDLETVGEQLGVKVVEVKTLRDAYALLTGIDLGDRPLIDTAALKTPADLTEALNIRVDMWRASAESGFARVQPVLNAMTPEVRESLTWLYAPIFQAVKAATAYEKAGQLHAAEQKWMEVMVATAAAEDELAIIEAARLGKLEEAFGVLMPYLELEEEAKTMMAEVGEALKSGGTAVGTVNAVLAAESVVTALALVGAGKTGLQAAVNTIKQLEKGEGADNSQRIQSFLLLLMKTAPVLARAESTLAGARMDLAFSSAAEQGGPAASSSSRLTSLARAYASGASAGKVYFQALVGLDDAASASFAFAEPAWATASAGADLAASFANKPDDVDHVLALAAGAQAFLSSAGLQNKYYALEYKNGVVGRASALTAELASARETALASSAEVQQLTGTVPTRIIAEFNRGEDMRGGSDDDKLEALNAYWRASFAADLLAELSRASVTTTSLPTIAIPPADEVAPIQKGPPGTVKKPVKPQKKLPVRKPLPKKALKK